ncbi:hypothetical protein [Methanonatronarchaeum sp. AMET-Sl]|uniref:hypothetical protein n=1 Tax=Methanonatronarchaeum sp. AMET-Sl TaxID=3037654 RepID=UPI00244DE754|nr:hypothetical protein [Methanonatronarchaeum sp. AMET-Sl]WGI17936.1 hypothetical protein QEN48_02720 [Methanonatronarchaeum sp. AMET-Sl]
MKVIQKLSDVNKGMYVLTRASPLFVVPLFFIHQMGKEAISVGETFNPAIMTLLLAGLITTIMLYQIAGFRKNN